MWYRARAIRQRYQISSGGGGASISGGNTYMHGNGGVGAVGRWGVGRWGIGAEWWRCRFIYAFVSVQFAIQAF